MAVKKALVLSCLLGASFLAQAAPASFVVQDIQVEGLQRVTLGAALLNLPIRVGDSVDSVTLANAIKKLYASGNFEDVKVYRDGQVLQVAVKERPTISSIEFSGNKDIKEEQLTQSLESSGIRVGDPLDRTVLSSLEKGLEDFYYGVGKYSAKVKAIVTPLPRNRVALKITINEGSVAAIQHINVVGNSVFPDEDLTTLFELKTTNWLSFFKNDDKYAREKLSGDLERLRSYYLDRGYINMDISSTQVSITPDKKHVYITVNVEEGEKYSVSEVKLSGDLKVPQEEIEKLLLVKEGQVFSRKVMTTTSELITRRLGNEGYTFANVNGVPQPNDEDKTVAITFVVDPGKRAYVNRINFRGNTKTEDEVLRREMRQMEGGWASTYLIDQSKVRLERLGYFKEVNVETPQVPGTDDQVDVNYSVEEQPSGSITASVGFAQNAGLILGGSISQNNFLGTGNKVSVGLTRSEYQTRYSFGFVDPYWTVDGVSLGYNAFYRTTDYDDLDVDVSSYAVDSYGAGMSIGYPISETSRLTYGLTIQQDSIDTGDYTVDEIISFMEQEGDSYLNLKASIGWSESTLNRGVLANRGHSQSLVLESTVPGSDLSFFKIDYRGQVFTPLNDKYTLRFHTELGFGDAYGSTSELPFYEHYFAGGFNSVRGFEDSSLGPRSTPSVVRDSNGKIVYNVQDKYGRFTDPDQDPLPFGGNVLIQGGAELLFPLPFVKDQRSLRTALFWDVGNVYDTSCSSSSPSCNNIDFGDLASSVGVGVTWVTAIGPLSFSLAAPIKKPEEADTQIFQFSLGQTF